MKEFIRRLDKAGWFQENDPDYTVPRRVIDRLAASFSQPLDIVEDSFTLITILEAKIEAEQAREEAYRRREQLVLRRLQEEQADHARKMEEKAEKDALKKANKEKKRLAKEKNQRNRIGAKLCGLT